MVGTPVLPNALNVDAWVSRTRKMTRINVAAAKHNGACVKVFNQAGDKNEKTGKTMTATVGLGKWYKQHVYAPNKPVGGVCQALCTYWLAFHANDESFWDWLISNGYMQVDKARIIIDAQIGYGNDRNPVKWEEKILRVGGIVRQGGASKGNLEWATRMGAGLLLGRNIAAHRIRSPGYKSISLLKSSGAGAHAVVAWVGQDVAFFDPNYGEYWFENRTDFVLWFSEYWVIAGYAYDEFVIDSYGKSIGSKRSPSSWM